MCNILHFIYYLDGRISFFLIFNQSDGENLLTLVDHLIFKGDQGALQKFKNENKIFYCLEDMVISMTDQNNINHYQFLYQKFSKYKTNNYLNKLFFSKVEEKSEITNNNNSFDLVLLKEQIFSKYELDDINEFIQRKNFPERNKFKCFML
jgi:hypothetical protein